MRNNYSLLKVLNVYSFTLYNNFLKKNSYKAISWHIFKRKENKSYIRIKLIFILFDDAVINGFLGNFKKMLLHKVKE